VGRWFFLGAFFLVGVGGRGGWERKAALSVPPFGSLFSTSPATRPGCVCET